jgi:hypothetical protein
VASVAYVAALPEADRAALLAEVARIAEGLDGPIAIPYQTDAYVGRPRTAAGRGVIRG